MNASERKAEIERLKHDEWIALNTSTFSEGTMSGMYYAGLSKHGRKQYNERVARKFDVEWQIKQLARTDEQIAADERAERERAWDAEQSQLENRVKYLSDFGTSRKTGKIRPTYQRAIDEAKARLAEIAQERSK